MPANNDIFNQAVIQTAEKIVLATQKNMLFMAVKPVVNMGLTALKMQIKDNPKEVYEWLLMAQVEIEKTLKLYNHENSP